MTPSASTPGKAYGYIRVSTVSQSLDRQSDAIVARGIHTADIYSDKISGARQNRPGLNEILRHVAPGDSITVHSLDRLGRTALHVLTTIADLDAKGVSIYSLKEGEDLTSTNGRLVAGIMAHIAQWEREMNRERVAEARAARAARAEAGEQVAGRPRTALTADKIAAVRKLRVKGRSAAEIAKLESMSRASVYRALEAAERIAPVTA